LQKNVVIPLVIGPSYIFFAHRSATYQQRIYNADQLLERTSGSSNTDILFTLWSEVSGGAVPVESDGRPRGSFNRWNYNEVYRSATPSAAGSGIRQHDTSNSVPPNNSDSFNRHWRARYRNSYTTTPLPTPGHRVEQDAKHDVDWAYDSMSFYLRVSINHPYT